MSNVDIHSEIRKNANQLEKVIEILKSHPEMAIMTFFDNLPLHTAMQYGGKGVFALVQVLVTIHPEGIKTKNSIGNLPIHLMPWTSYDEAGRESSRRAQEFLLKEFPEGSQTQNNRGELPIHYAARKGRLSTVQLFLQEYPQGSKVADNNGRLPIHHVCDQETPDKDTGELVVELVFVYPEGVQHKDKNGKLPIDILVMKKNYTMIRSLAGSLAQALPDIFDVPCSAIISILEGTNGLTKDPLETASCLLNHCKKINTKQMNWLESKLASIKRWKDLVQELKGKLASMKRGKDPAQIAMSEEHKRELEKEKKSASELNIIYNKILERKLTSMKHEKDLAQTALHERNKELEKEKESVAALIKDNKKYDDERKKYQDKLEQERQRVEKSFETEVASLKQQVDHAEKRVHLLEEARKSEAKLLSRILETSDDWTIQDLKSILKSLNARLDAMNTQFQPGSQPSMTQRLLPYLLNGGSPSKEDLLRSIEAINSELSEVESNLAKASSADDASIPVATLPSDASPENASRKRARVSLSPA
jgi:hypothetical protein